MALREDFERSGNWLFRRRGHLPLVLICFFVLVMRGHDYPEIDETGERVRDALCLAVSFLGLLVRAITVGHTPRGTSGRNTDEQVADVLNTTGLYSVMRNPLYLGNFLMYLGIAMFTGVWWLSLVFALAFWLYYERIIFAEEAYLREKFGASYLAWADTTPAFFPRLTGYRRAALPFSLRNVLRREYNGFFAVVVVMFVLDFLRELFIRGNAAFDRGWVIGLAAAFVIWAVLRSLKKLTRLLDVAGR